MIIALNLLKQVFGLGAVVSVLYYIYWQLTTGAQRRAIIKEKGCLPVRRHRTKDPFFGIDAFLEVLRRHKERSLLQLHVERLQAGNGSTVSLGLLGRTFILTVEPENLKTIQALNFKHWSLGTRRKRNFKPFLGTGIFTTDGAEWHHSREMLRPNFHRSQIGDLDTFEHHIQHLIQAIPRDGSMVDLSDLFFRLTMDSATEFLFGESTFCLAPGTETVSNARFAEAFNRGQESISNKGRWGWLSALFSEDQFKEDVKFVHGQYELGNIAMILRN